MALDSNLANDKPSPVAEDSSGLSLFAQSFKYEAKSELLGVAQLVGRDVTLPRAPETASSVLGQHAQMVGRALADVVPTLATAAALRFGPLRNTSPEFTTNLFLKRSPIGLNMVESGATGFLTGALLKPNDPGDGAVHLVADRLKSGVVDGISFSLLTGINSSIVSAGDKMSWQLGKDLLTNSIAGGALSGAVGGAVNVELQSLANGWKFTTDGGKIGQSMYEMALFGGSFNALGELGRGFHQKAFSDAATLKRDFALDPQAASRVELLSKDGVDLKGVRNFVLEHGEDGKSLVQRVLKETYNPLATTSGSLSAISEIEKRLSLDSASFTNLLDAQRMGLNLQNFNESLQRGDEGMQTFARQTLQTGSDVTVLNPNRFEALNYIRQALGDDTGTFQKIMQMQSGAKDLIWFVDALKLQKEKVSLIRDAAETGQPEKLSEKYVRSRLQIDKTLEGHPAAQARFRELDKQGLDTFGFAKILKESSQPGAAISLLEMGAPKEALGYEHLTAQDFLTRKYGQDSDVIKTLLSSKDPNVDLITATQFVLEKAGNEEVLKQLLSGPEGIDGLDFRRLHESTNVDRLKKFFPENEKVIEHISELKKDETLSAARLYNYLLEDSQSRVPMIEQLVSEDAAARKLNRLMDLSVLPDDVALKVVGASNESKTTGTVLSNLRNWRSGANFAALLSKHVRAGGELSAEAIDKVAASANEITPGRAASGIAYEAPHRPFGIDNSKRPLNRERVSARDDLVTDAAKIVALSARKIDAAVPKDKTIVLLGRDTWPLVPMLKAQGRDVQYFMWTRLQLEDPATKAQWLKEVPPHSVIVDTGLAGSILDSIKTIDPSAQGLLIQSHGKYPWLLPNGDRSIFDMERFPKLIGRSETYTSNGGAVSKPKLRDDDEYALKGNRDYRWDIEKNNSQLLRMMGLSEWDVWRYRRYTGLTPQERLFADSPDQVARKYEEVRKMRHLDIQK